MAMFPDLPNLYSAFTVISGYKQWRIQNRVVGRAQVGHTYTVQCAMCGIKLACGKLNYKQMLEHKQSCSGTFPGVPGLMATPVDIKPGKLDLLFRINHLLDLHAGALMRNDKSSLPGLRVTSVRSWIDCTGYIEST